MEMIKDNLLHLLLHLFLFTKDHTSFTFNGSLLKLTILKDIREDFYRSRNVIFKDFGVVGRLFSRGVSI